MRALHLALILLALPMASPAIAADVAVPDALRPWVPWVLFGHDEVRCSRVNDAPLCVWPGTLSLQVQSRSGAFDVRVTTVIEHTLALPGGDDAWPEGVVVDGKRAPVIDEDGVPSVRLGAGEHTVSGRFSWAEQPDALVVPEVYALVRLSVRGRDVPFPRRQGDSVSLERDDDGGAERDDDTLEVAIMRRIVDDAPLLVETRLLLEVAGKAREITVPGALLAGFEAASVSSSVPARLEGTKLRAQVRPGSLAITVVGRAADPGTPLTAASAFADGPPEEIWVYEARPALRLAHVEGAQAVAPEQTRLPKEWQRFPAFRLAPDEALTLVEDRRGDADPPKSRLTIARDIWLDFDGNGATARDRVTGTFTGDRLEMGRETTLGHVTVGGVDGTITTLGEGGGLPGVELRQRQLDMVAESRIERPLPRLPAVSWAHDFQSAELSLHLPPGHTLLHADGVDGVLDTWVKRWSLFEIFLVVVLTAAALRLWGPVVAALAGACFVVSFQESGAPMAAWVVVITLAGLHRALPEAWQGLRLARTLALLRISVAVVTGLIAVDFATTQVRTAMYPVLEQPWRRIDDGTPAGRSFGLVAKTTAPPAPMAQEPSNQAIQQDVDDRPQFKDRANNDKLEDLELGLAGSGSGGGGYANSVSSLSAKVGSKKARPRRQVAQVDPNAYAQTGPGLPTWSWETVDLTFSGPVQSDQVISLTILGPRASAALAFLRVLLIAALLLVALGAPGQALGRAFPRLRGRGALWGTIVAVAIAGGAPAHAEVPSTELLDELRERLTAPTARCAEPPCVTIAALDVDASAQALRLRLEVHAADDNATVALPGDPEQWLPSTVLIDGKGAGVAMANGVMVCRVDAGVHDVVLEGPLPPTDSVQLALPLVPKRGSARAQGWTVDGVHDDGTVDANLQLSRTERGAAQPRDELAPTVLPPFLRVERTLLLGLTFEVETRVVRLSPIGTPIVVDVPLLDGESVTTDGVRAEVKDGKGAAKMSLGPSDVELTWHSTLAQTSAINLAAPRGVPWVEQWQLQGSPLWHVVRTGIPPIHDPTESMAQTYRPWPGESLALALTRPAAVAGQTHTIDSVEVAASPGLRSTSATLTFVIRSSRGGQHRVTLPENAELLSATINSIKQPLRQEQGKVTVPLTPGSQRVVLETRLPTGIQAITRTPVFDVGAPATNVSTVVSMPDDRWTLFASGMGDGVRAGPAVLFWSFLIIIVAVALALSRVPQSPLRAHHWVLLSLGLTQVPVPLAAIVAGWLLALGWRRRPEFTEPGRLHPAFFGLAQLTLLGWTLIALGIFVGSIHEGLHGSPDMLIKGNGSSANQLRWFVDRTVGAALPSASIVSLPLLAWRLTILAWSLWLATALLRWLAQGFRAFGDGGFFRDPFPTKPKPPAGATAAKDMTIPETPAADAPTSAAAMSAAAVTAAREPLASKPTDESGGSGPTS